MNTTKRLVSILIATTNKANYHEDKAEWYAYMAELRHKQYDTFMQLLRN